MLGVYWAIKKFEYQLKGRRFILETDHKAIEKIRYFILFIFIKLPIILGIIIHYRTGVVYYS